MLKHPRSDGDLTRKSKKETFIAPCRSRMERIDAKVRCEVDLVEG